MTKYLIVTVVTESKQIALCLEDHKKDVKYILAISFPPYKVVNTQIQYV